jgi:hypothetical protein
MHTSKPIIVRILEASALALAFIENLVTKSKPHHR